MGRLFTYFSAFWQNAVLALLLLAVCSCGQEEFPGYASPGTEHLCTLEFAHSDFEVVDISTRATVGAVQENRVLNMYLFVFGPDGRRIYSRYFNKDDKGTTYAAVSQATDECWYVSTASDGTTSGIVRIKAPSVSNAVVYLVANLDEDMYDISPELLGSVSTLQQLERTGIAMQQLTTSRNGYFPMTARLQGVNITSSSVSGAKLQLERMDAKVTLNIKLGTEADLKSFTPSWCKVVNIPAGCMIASSSLGEENEQAGYFTSEVDFDNTITCSFYLLENRESRNLKNKVGGYHSRDARIKFPDGTYNASAGMWLNAPENATYMQIAGEIHQQIPTQLGGIQDLIGEVVYYVHLGDFAADVNDYDVVRNTHYTYNITVHGVDNIEVEVETNVENQSGATGHIYTSFEPVQNFDAHYGQRVFAVRAEDIIDKRITFYTSTPFGRSGTPINSSGEYNISDLDYKWVTFLVNNKEGGSYSFNNRLYPGDGSQMLIAAGSSERLMNVVQLLDFIEREKVKYVQYKESGFAGKNPSAFLPDSKGVYTMNITAFINEFFYQEHPTENVPITWKDFVNRPARLMHILTEAKISNDGESSYTHSLVTFRQRSIQTPYNIGSQGVDAAFGCETVDETRELNLPFYENDNSYKGKDLGNKSTSNGIYNMACLWNLLQGGSFAGGDGRQKWSDYLNYEVPNSTEAEHNHFLKDDTRCLRYAAMSRNRDNNGNGFIDPQEVRWYIAPLERLYDLYTGDKGMDPEAWLYPRSLATAANVQENGVWIWRNHIICSNQTTVSYSSQYVDKYWPDMFWAEEGVSLSGYTKDWGKVSCNSIKCLRNLGMDDATESSIADVAQNVPPQMVVAGLASQGVFRFDLSNVNSKSVRYFTTHELIPESENGETSRTYYGFETHKDYISYGTGKDYAMLKAKLDVGDSPCPEGYRIPNVREAALMALYCPSSWWNGTSILSCSYYSHGSLGGSLYYDTNTTTWFFGEKYITVNGDKNALRCVRDLRQ